VDFNELGCLSVAVKISMTWMSGNVMNMFEISYFGKKLIWISGPQISMLHIMILFCWDNR
jgi:hypothetical protein